MKKTKNTSGKIFLFFLFLIPTFANSSNTEHEGLLFPGDQIVLSILTSGVVTDLPYKMGESVKKGDLLLKLDAEKDSLQLVLAKRELDKSAIHKAGEIEKEIAFRLKKIAYSEKFIRAPFNGTLVAIMAKKHEYYSAGSKVVELVDLKNLYTEINVSDSDLNKLLSPDHNITVNRGKESLKAKVHSHNPIAEPGLEVYLVKIIFPNKFSWSPGTNVKISY